jgi:hypothetical protein
MYKIKSKLKWHLEHAGPVHASGDTTRSLRVLGKEVIGLQISKTSDAAERHVAVAIRSIVTDDVLQIGVAALHCDEASLLGTTQIADVVGDGWDILGAFGTRHITDSHFRICL